MMNTRTTGHHLVGSNSSKPATTKERVAMAAGWPLADAIPDRVFTLRGELLAQYWERDVLLDDRLHGLEWFVRDVGTLASVGAITEAAAQAAIKALVGVFTSRGYAESIDEFQEAMGRWLASGRGLDPRNALSGDYGVGDPHHKPTPPRLICPHCGGAQ